MAGVSREINEDQAVPIVDGSGKGAYFGLVTEVVVDGLVAGTGLPESAVLDGRFTGLGRAGSRFLEPP